MYQAFEPSAPLYDSDQDREQQPESGAKVCKFCEEEEESKNNALISPCRCAGSLKYVHRQCLNQWRAQNLHDSMNVCTLCLFRYQLIPEPADPVIERQRLLDYRWSVFHDLSIAFIQIQLVIVLLAGVLYWCNFLSYIKSLTSMSNDDDASWMILLNASSWMTNYVWSVLLLLECIGIISCIKWLVSLCTSDSDNEPLRRYDYERRHYFRYRPYGYGYYGHNNSYWNGVLDGMSFGRNVNPPPTSQSTSSKSSSKSKSNGTSSSSNDSKALIIVFVIFVVIGFCVAMFIGIRGIYKTTTTHCERIWRFQEAQRFIVRDFNGQEHLIA